MRSTNHSSLYNKVKTLYDNVKSDLKSIKGVTREKIELLMTLDTLSKMLTEIKTLEKGDHNVDGYIQKH